MGAWGTGISSNDEYLDFYDEIMEEFNKGNPIQTVIDNVVNKYAGEFENDKNSLHNLYFAAAYAEWECGINKSNLFSKVKEIIVNGSDIECWKELGASQLDLKKREKALVAFLNKISTQKSAPKKPKAIKFKPALFLKGDILSIQLDDRSFSGAVVLENIKVSDEFGSNFIVKAYMSKLDKPTVSEILNSKVYDFAWYLGVLYKKYIKQIEVIGRIDIKHEYESGGVGSISSGWGHFVSSNNEKNYLFKENSDIKSVSSFISMKPEEIAKRQAERVRRSMQNILNKRN